MKVLFLYPAADSQVGFNYGVASISAVLKQAGHDATLWTLCEDLAPLPTPEQFTKRLRQEAPDIVAFSAVTPQWPYIQRLARWARDCFAGPIVLGGVHTVTGVEPILETGLFDYIFRGECEDAFLEFVDKLDAGEDATAVRNLACCVDGGVRVNPMRPLPRINTLPQKDYSMMDFQQLIDAKHGWVGLMASRGCPYSCTYCFNHQMVAAYKRDLQCGFKDLHYIRHHDIGQVIGEIRYLLDNYRRIAMFIFDDDLFTYDKAFVREFCREYKALTDLPFVVNSHVGFFDEDLAAALGDAGCRIVKFGVESGSESIRKQILNRHMSNDAVCDAIELVGRYGMHSSVFLMIGLPHETRADVEQTIYLMARARPGRFRWTFFYPFPGTQAHANSRDGGFIDDDKLARLANFTDQSSLKFGREHELYLRKVGKVLPWFVNAASDLAAAPLYSDRVAHLLTLDEAQWTTHEPTLLAEDEKLSQYLSTQNLTHYAIKYNPFMGVTSDYFLNEP